MVENVQNTYLFGLSVPTSDSQLPNKTSIHTIIYITTLPLQHNTTPYTTLQQLTWIRIHTYNHTSIHANIHITIHTYNHKYNHNRYMHSTTRKCRSSWHWSSPGTSRARTPLSASSRGAHMLSIVR